ncbi:hypothetical protein [Bartonella sp. CB169]|uniref:hypothetical protein n=1 Tax=Bartonella sp. CB169 TaxID=3112257 RepID=UPI003FA59DF0
MHLFIVVAIFDILTMKAFAATVKNADLKAQYLVVAEGGMSLNIPLNVNQTITLCMKGCFITFPNKDRFAIKAEDNIEISGGRAVFK